MVLMVFRAVHLAYGLRDLHSCHLSFLLGEPIQPLQSILDTIDNFLAKYYFPQILP